MNNSDTEIVQFTFAPPSAGYYNNGSATPIEQASPAVMQISVSIPPHSSQIETFQTCTTTPPPGNYSFSVFAPASVPFRWVTGATGTAGWLH